MQRENANAPADFDVTVEPAVVVVADLVVGPRLATVGVVPPPPQPAATIAAPSTAARAVARTIELTRKGIALRRFRAGDRVRYSAVTSNRHAVKPPAGAH